MAKYILFGVSPDLRFFDVIFMFNWKQVGLGNDKILIAINRAIKIINRSRVNRDNHIFCTDSAKPLSFPSLLSYRCSNNSNNTHTHTQTFNGLFSRTTWVGRYQKDKPFWILLKWETTGWQWHQPNHMQTIFTPLQPDNHASTSSLHIFLQAVCPSCRPSNSVQALKALITATTVLKIL